MGQKPPLTALSAFIIWATLGVFGAVGATPHPLAAQVRSRLDLGGNIEVGGEEERYLRVLQIAGVAPLTPWSIQPFSPTQTRLLRVSGSHPWSQRFASDDTASSVRFLRPKARLIGNSAFPFQDGGGPTWAGRGITGEIQAGVFAAWKDVFVQLAPLAFVGQNAAFALAPNGQPSNARFADARFPGAIDAPQRFGDRAYGRLEPGSSSVTLDVFHVLAGISSAPQRWGPAREFPLNIGPNGGGFPEVYLGTSEPINFWLFQGHGRVVYGELGQSSYSADVAGQRKRLGSGLVLTALPRGLPGLEIGGTRFIHRPWSDASNVHALLRPFSGGGNIIGTSAAENDLFENQTASVFARWALPAAKAEFYAEMYREDFFGKFHQAPGSLVEKPDDYSTFTLGFQRVFTSTERMIRVLRGELVNGQVSHQERTERGFAIPLPPYIHTEVTQGHTVNGLLLGSPEAYGGEAWRLGMDEFSPAGRRSITLERSLRFDWLPGTPLDGTLVHPDVIFDVRAEALRFAGKHDYGVTLIPAIDLNRNLVAHHDVFNLTVAVVARGW